MKFTAATTTLLAFLMPFLVAAQLRGEIEKGFTLRDDLPKSLEELRAENEAAMEREKKEREELRARRDQERAERKKRFQEEAKNREEAAEASADQSATDAKSEGVASEL
eukprot:scaffold40361_cov221-Amphora_coffeaeformis.AAC.2